jgi:peptidoglycan L-alanyl-D-glutamate endopeptidase CwlK
MASRKIQDLNPRLQEIAPVHIRLCEEAGVPIILTCTARDNMEQMALYSQGRMPLEYVNMMRTEAGIWLIGKEENKRKVTWILKSRHVVDLDKGEKAKAYDVALLRVVKGRNRAHWNLKEDVNGNDIPDYEEVARIGESLGLVAGARWNSPDWPHFQ